MFNRWGLIITYDVLKQHTMNVFCIHNYCLIVTYDVLKHYGVPKHHPIYKVKFNSNIRHIETTAPDLESLFLLITTYDIL